MRDDTSVDFALQVSNRLPIGAANRALNELEVVAYERPTAIAIRTTSGPVRFLYRYRFSAENGES